METLPARRFVIAGLVALLAMLTTSGCVAQGKIPSIPSLQTPAHPTTTTMVPPCIGLTEANAKLLLSDANLAANVVHENGADGSTKGTVTRQSPEGGAVVQLGSTVTITVNVGPVGGIIPKDLIGLTESAAKQELYGANFTNVVSETASAGTFEPPNAKAGDVLDVRPAPGTTVPLDTQITLVLASGMTAMPSVKGLTEADAKTLLAASGFIDVRVTHQMNGTVPAGTVFMQNPEALTPAFRINPVFIYIADAPPPPPPAKTSSPPAPPTTSSVPQPTST